MVSDIEEKFHYHFPSYSSHLKAPLSWGLMGDAVVTAAAGAEAWPKVGLHDNYRSRFYDYGLRKNPWTSIYFTKRPIKSHEHFFVQMFFLFFCCFIKNERRKRRACSSAGGMPLRGIQAVWLSIESINGAMLFSCFAALKAQVLTGCYFTDCKWQKQSLPEPCFKLRLIV